MMSSVGKRGLLAAFACLCAACMAIGLCLPPAKAAETGAWTAGSGSSLEGSILTGGEDGRAQVTYAGADFVEGGQLSYQFASRKDFSVGYEVNALDEAGFPKDNARIHDHSYVKFTVLNEKNEGFEVKFYHQNPDYEVEPNKLEINLTWLSPAIAADAAQSKETGRHYVETVYSFVNNFGAPHTLSCYRYAGAYRISVDGTTFMPVPEYGEFDLSNVSVTVDFMAVDKRVRAELGAGTDFDPSHAGVWSTMGDSVITENADGTTTFSVEDATEKMPVSTPIVQLREKIISTEGLDVRKPIVLQVAYSRYTGLTWFWGLGLAKQPYDTYKLQFDDFGRGENETNTYRNNGFVADGKGLFIQPETGKIENTTIPGGTDLVSYRTNDFMGAGYTGLECLDTIRYEIGETDTDIWYNGEKIFDHFAMKQSDFASSDYRAYPGFAFLELPSSVNQSRSNTLTIKGANAPYREETSGIRYSESAEGCKIDIDCFGESPTLSYDAAGTETVSAENYSYDDGSKELTLKPAFFTNFGSAPRHVFVSTKNGTAQLQVRFVPEGEVIEAAEVLDKELRFELGKKRDFTFKIDCKGQTFSRVFGLGLFLRDVEFDESTGTISINARALNDLDVGEYVINIETIDLDGNYLVTTVPFYVDKNPYEGMQSNGSASGETKAGCGKSSASAGGLAALVAILAAVGVIRKY